jgi:hypothetical protein
MNHLLTQARNELQKTVFFTEQIFGACADKGRVRVRVCVYIYIYIYIYIAYTYNMCELLRASDLVKCFVRVF